MFNEKIDGLPDRDRNSKEQELAALSGLVHEDMSLAGPVVCAGAVHCQPRAGCVLDVGRTAI